MELFHYCDLELDHVTFISELDLDIVVTYLHDKSEVSRSNGSKVIIWADIQTDRHQGNLYLPVFAGDNKTTLMMIVTTVIMMVLMMIIATTAIAPTNIDNNKNSPSIEGKPPACLKNSTENAHQISHVLIKVEV